MNLLAEMSWGQWMLAVVITLICLFLMLVILLQRGRGMGIAGAFGGGGGSSAFGAKTGDVFTWITVVVAGVFLLLIVAGNFIFDMSAQARTEPIVATGGPEPDSGAVPLTPVQPGKAPGETAKFPIRLEQVPVDPNDPSKGTELKAVQMTPEEAAAAGAKPSGGTAPAPAGAQTPKTDPASPPAKAGESDEPAETDEDEPEDQ